MRVTLSEEADSDLNDIFDYTLSVHGLEQAQKYTMGFDDVFLSLSENPRIGKDRSEIFRDLRSLSKGHHIVFYLIREDYILIARILHESSDLPEFFKYDKPH